MKAEKSRKIPPQELNEYISEFIVAVRRKDGEHFEPASFRGLICSFNRYSKACKYPCSVIEDSQFEQVRQALEARSKELKKRRQRKWAKLSSRSYYRRRSKKFYKINNYFEFQMLRPCWIRCGLWTPSTLNWEDVMSTVVWSEDTFNC